MVEAINTALFDLLGNVIAFAPNLIGFLILLLIGYIIGVLVGNLVRRLLRRLDSHLERYEIDKMLPMKLSELLGKLVRYFIVLVFLVAGADILGVEAITAFLNDVLRYLPNVFVAVVIIAITMVISKAVAPLIHHAKLSQLARYAILVFGSLTALSQLGIGEDLINILMIGFVAAAALAFGLGGKEKARELLDKVL